MGQPIQTRTHMVEERHLGTPHQDKEGHMDFVDLFDWLVGLPRPQGLPSLLPSTTVIVRRLNLSPWPLCFYLILFHPSLLLCFPMSSFLFMFRFPALNFGAHSWLHPDS